MILYLHLERKTHSFSKRGLPINREDWTLSWRKSYNLEVIIIIYSARRSFSSFLKGVLESWVSNRARALSSSSSSLDISAGGATVGTDRRRARSSAGRAAVPPRAVLRREGLSRFHKCPVRRRGSRLGSKMSSWVQLLLALLAACLRFGVAEVGLHHSRTFELLEMLHIFCKNH